MGAVDVKRHSDEAVDVKGHLFPGCDSWYRSVVSEQGTLLTICPLTYFTAPLNQTG